MEGKGYQDLVLWQKSMKVVVDVYSKIKKLPTEESFGLANQMRRSAVSIPSNIAEGQGRNGSKEFIQFLYIANGSRAELETQLLLCIKIGYLKEEELVEIFSLLKEIEKMTIRLINTLKNL